MPVRGCIIKDELVTISNRQTNWTTLGLPPGAHDALSKTKTITQATSWDIKITTIPTEELVLYARNSTTRYFRGFVRPSRRVDRYTLPCKRIRSDSSTCGHENYQSTLRCNEQRIVKFGVAIVNRYPWQIIILRIDEISIDPCSPLTSTRYITIYIIFKQKNLQIYRTIVAFYRNVGRTPRGKLIKLRKWGDLEIKPVRSLPT